MEENTPRRRPPRSVHHKLRDILTCIQEAGWSLSLFLKHLFDLQDDVVRSPQHEQMLISLLTGVSKPPFGEIVDLIYRNSLNVVGGRSNASAFIPGANLVNISHSKPALTTFSLDLVIKEIRKEADKMSDRSTGLHLRAKAPKPNAQRDHGPHVTWSTISNFSMYALQGIAEENAPIMWHIISAYSNPAYRGDRVYAIRQRRPQNLVLV